MSKNADEIKKINELLEESVGLNEKRAAYYKRIAEGIKEGVNAEEDFKRLQKDINEEVRKANRSFNDMAEQLKNITGELSKQYSNQNQMVKGLKGMTAQANKLANEESNISSFNKKQLLSMQEKIKAEKERASEAAKGLISDLKLGKGLKKNGDLTKTAQEKINKLREDGRSKDADAAVAALGLLRDEDNIIKDLNDKLEERIQLEDDFAKKIGFAGQAAAGLDKALQKAGIPSLGIADAIDKAKKKFIETEGKSNVFKDTLKGVLGNLKEAASFANLMQIGFGLLVKSVLEVDKASGEFAKNNGISYQNSLAIRGEMNEIARSSNDVVVSSKALMETQGTLNKFFGQSTKFTGKLAEDMTSIAKRTGLSEEAQGTFALEAMKSGKGVKDILKNQTLTVMEMNKQEGLQMSVKQVQEAISKTSNAVFMTFKGSTEELTKQVMSVKALGANMQQVEGIASSLLDFEGSIQAELEAELLLGKQINLEKAREAALRGDMGKVAEEVMGNEAIMNAFATDNVIQQEAAAKALGMNRDQLAGMIKEQEKLEAVRSAGFDNMNDAQKEYNKLRDDGYSKEAAAAAIGDDNLAAQLESVSAAEKFEGTMARVQELFVALAEPILAVVQPIADILVPALQGVSFIMENLVAAFEAVKDYIMESVPAMVTFATVLAGILINQQRIAYKKEEGLAYDTAQYLMAKKKLIVDNASLVKKKIQNSLENKGLLKTIGSAAMTAFKSVATIPFIGPILGAAAAASAVAFGMSLYNKAGDVMSPADGKTRISTKEGGLFELSPNDDLIAAPGAANAMNKKGGGAGGNAALIAEVRTLININRQILAKSPVIEMNGNKVGEEINQSERKVQ